MENLHDIAEREWLGRHQDALMNVAKYHYDEGHVPIWKAFYEKDYQTKFYGGSLIGWSKLSSVWVKAMQGYVDKGLAPTPAQVGARPWMVVWVHRLYGQTGAAAMTILKEWSQDLGQRISMAQARCKR